ncbi:unnamed protein product [Heterobilharzia americana]|nr:unnamed protein product [Heterobilharzia americana]
MSPGNFLSSTTLLPSGPCSSLTALMLIFWLRRRYFLAVGCVAFSGLVVWPFAAVLGLPLATYMVITGKFRCLVKSALVWLLLITFPLVAVDSFYFGRFVLAPINILRYNLFPYDKQQTGSASQLYGVEPISFYLKNYILNQNIMCILALLSLIHAVIKLVLLPFRIKKSVEKHFNETETSLSKICIIVCTCLAIWNSIFFLQAHKEERFLFPCYPLIAIASTIVISEIIEALTSKTKLAGIKSSVTCFIIITFCSVVFLTSVSRIFTLVRWHSSPMYLVKHLPAPLGQSHKPLLCMGRDWHFFPSRFFLPGGGEKWEVGFVQSNFSGQLPGQFAKPVSSGMVSSSTRKDGNHFNSGNVEEIDRYVINASDKCSFMLDRDSPTAFRETLYVSEQETWLSFANRTLLESTSCSFNETFLSLDVIYCRLLRTFYIPVLSQKMDLTTALHILVRRNHGLFA